MKPMKVKSLLSHFGEIGRIFLSPEDPKVYARRVRFGGNKKRNFEEGWVEFKSKKVARLVAETLNATIIGEKQSALFVICSSRELQTNPSAAQVGRRGAITMTMYGTSNTFQSSSGIIYKLKLVRFFARPLLKLP